MDDPILEELVRFTLRYGRWIAAAIVIAVIAGAASGLSKPPSYSMRAVYATATTATEGPVESFELAVRRVGERLSRAIAAGELPGDVSLDAHGLTGQPPNLESTHLMEMIATGSDPESLRRAIQLAGDELTKAQTPFARDDRARLDRHIAAVEADLSRIERVKPTRERHELFLKEVRELVDSSRLASPVRSYEPAFIGVFEPKRETRARKLMLPVALGISAGIAGGYALAFVIAGAAAYRRIRRDLAASSAKRAKS